MEGVCVLAVVDRFLFSCSFGEMVCRWSRVWGGGAVKAALQMTIWQVLWLYFIVY